MIRQKVVDQILRAKNIEQVRAARLARATYLHEHPDDWEILEYGSMLSRLEEALQVTETEQMARSA